MAKNASLQHPFPFLSDVLDAADPKKKTQLKIQITYRPAFHRRRCFRR